MRWLSILILLGALATTEALADTPKGTSGVTSFGAQKAERPAPAPDDFRAMLAVCDEQREGCEKDAIGVPYLAAAYLALWVILMAFLYAVRVGTLRTRAEMEELRARLRELEESAG